MSILNSLTKLITPELIGTLSKSLKEDNSKVSKALTGMIPALLSSFMQKGNTSTMESILKMAGGKSDKLSDPASIFTAKPSSVSGDFLSSILGNKQDKLVSGIAKDSGISEASSSILMNGAAGMIAKTLGKQMMSGANLNGIMDSLSLDSKSITAAVPKGVSSFVCSPDIAEKAKTITSKMGNNAGKGKKRGGSGWWKWLLALLIIALICFFFLRKCGSCSRQVDVKDTTTAISTTITDKVTVVESEIQNLGEKLDIKKISRPAVKIKTPSGKELQAFKDGAEVHVLDVLEHTDLNAVEPGKLLEESWFVFDNIDFGSDGRTLTPDSDLQLENLATILKEYPDAKIKIKTVSDKDSKIENQSVEQAEAIKVKLINAGADAQNIDVMKLVDEMGYQIDNPELIKKVNERRTTFLLKKKAE